MSSNWLGPGLTDPSVITEACTMRRSGTALSFLLTEVSSLGLGSVQEPGPEVLALKRPEMPNVSAQEN